MVFALAGDSTTTRYLAPLRLGTGAAFTVARVRLGLAAAGAVAMRAEVARALGARRAAAGPAAAGARSLPLGAGALAAAAFLVRVAIGRLHPLALHAAAPKDEAVRLPFNEAAAHPAPQ